MDWRSHIVLDPAICHGRPTFRGTRVLVSTVLAYLADDHDADAICREFPGLTAQAVSAALAFAADAVAGERVIATT